MENFFKDVTKNIDDDTLKSIRKKILEANPNDIMDRFIAGESFDESVNRMQRMLKD